MLCDVLHSGLRPNVYFEKAVECAMATAGREAVQQALRLGLSVVLLGDNNFYSQRDWLRSQSLPLRAHSLEQLPLFCEPFSPMASAQTTPSSALPRIPSRTFSTPGTPASSASCDSLPVIHKTGLGSSAALVTSVIAAFLNLFGVLTEQVVCVYMYVCV